MDSRVNKARSILPDRRGIQSVEIAVRVLTALQRSTVALPLKDIAAGAGLTASAANNYLVSLVRTRLVQADVRSGYYKLGPGALSLGMSALQQIDGYEALRREVTALRDSTVRNAALAGWSDAGPVSLFKQDGEHFSGLPFNKSDPATGEEGTRCGGRRPCSRSGGHSEGAQGYETRSLCGGDEGPSQWLCLDSCAGMEHECGSTFCHRTNGRARYAGYFARRTSCCRAARGFRACERIRRRFCVCPAAALP